MLFSIATDLLYYLNVCIWEHECRTDWVIWPGALLLEIWVPFVDNTKDFPYLMTTVPKLLEIRVLNEYLIFDEYNLGTFRKL